MYSSITRLAFCSKAFASNSPFDAVFISEAAAGSIIPPKRNTSYGLVVKVGVERDEARFVAPVGPCFRAQWSILVVRNDPIRRFLRL